MLTTALGGNYANVIAPFLIKSADAFRTWGPSRPALAVRSAVHQLV